MVDVVDMTDADVGPFDPDTLHLIICSTHGEGELPSAAEPFTSTLDETHADLGGWAKDALTLLLESTSS